MVSSANILQVRLQIICHFASPPFDIVINENIRYKSTVVGDIYCTLALQVINIEYKFQANN